MPQHVSKERFIGVLNRILKSNLSPNEKMDKWINFLLFLKENLFVSKYQKPTEYFTFDYYGIRDVFLDPGLLSLFTKSPEEFFEIQQKYFRFMVCKNIEKGKPIPPTEFDASGNPVKRCGFNWEFWNSRNKWKEYINRGERVEMSGKNRRKRTHRRKRRRRRRRQSTRRRK